MALEGEYSDTLEPIKCMDCGVSLDVEVLHSNAGWYIGRFCPNDGPYERLSDYFQTKTYTEAELKFWKENGVRPFGRDTNYHGEE